MASLRRIKPDDGAGDSGSYVRARNPKSGKIVGEEPIVGARLQVGSAFARTYHPHDWWLTTEVVDITPIKRFDGEDLPEGSLQLTTKSGSEYLFIP